MNQGIIWTIVVVLVLLVVAIFAWNVAKQPVVEPSPTEAMEDTMESPLPTDLSDVMTPTPAPVQDASVVVGPQTRGTTVTVQSVYLTQPGFVDVHADNNGKPGTSLGHSEFLPAGTHANVPVKLSRSSKNGETLDVMVHVDTNNDGKYVYPGDNPAMTSSGTVVVVPVTVGASPSPSAMTGDKMMMKGDTMMASPSASAAPLYSY